MQSLLEGLQSERGKLDDLKDDIKDQDSNATTMQTMFSEVENKLEECLAQTSDAQSDLECVLDQFNEYNTAVQEWRAWFFPAKATLEGCKELNESKASLERMSENLQVSCDF